MSRQLKILSLSCLLILSMLNEAKAQYNAYWAFGDYLGINFKGCSMNAENTHKKLSGNNNSYYKSSICDSTGNIALFTNGDSVWDKNSRPIIGNPIKYMYSSSIFNYNPFYCTLLLPKGKTGYWLFNNYDTVVSVNGVRVATAPGAGLYYSEIQNARSGNWQITPQNKNIPLYLSFGTGKITAVKGTKPFEYWLLYRSADTLFAFDLDSSHISPPVKTFISDTLTNLLNTQYILSPSPDGRTVVSISNCMTNESAYFNKIPQGAYAYTYSFNNETGIFSNPLLLDSFKYNISGGRFKTITAAAFAPNDSLLYLTEWVFIPHSNSFQYIYQYQRLKTGKFSPRTNILGDSLVTSQTFGDIKLGPDGKLYLLKGGYCYLSLINFPERQGAACGLAIDAINACPNLGSNPGASFANTLNEYINLGYKTTPICGGLHFTAVHDSILQSFKWFVTSASGFTDSAAGEQADIVVKTPSDLPGGALWLFERGVPPLLYRQFQANQSSKRILHCNHRYCL